MICLDIWILGAFITHLRVAYYFSEVSVGDSRKILFGNRFGTVNAQVSALAFVGMIVALVLQCFESSFQRNELRDSR